LEIPLSPGTFRHLKHGIAIKLEIIRLLETTKPPKRITGRDCLGEQDSLLGFRRERKQSAWSKTLTPRVILSSFDGPVGDEGYGLKDEFWKMRKDSRAPRVSLLGLSHENPGDEKHSFIFGIRKAWFWIPPT
jgi:hypothetical protein